MSSNSSGSSSNVDDPLKAFATPYFEWLEDEVFPVFVGITNIFILIIGIILNSLLLHAIRKKRLAISSGKEFLLNLIVLDLVAYIFILVPSTIAAFTNSRNLSDFFCTLNGALVTACFLMTFYTLCVIFVERWMKITDPELHEKTFSKIKVCVFIIITFWIIFFAVGLLPKTGWSELKYISYQHTCNINHNANSTGMVLYFVFGMIMPAIISVIFMALISRKRKDILRVLTDLQAQVDLMKKKIQQSKDVFSNNNKISMAGDKNRNLGQRDDSTISISHIDTGGSKSEPSSEIEVLNTEIIQNGAIPGSITSRSEAEIREQILSTNSEKSDDVRNTVVDHVYRNSEEYVDIHLTITYAIMWSIIILMWAPYALLCFIDAFSELPIWGGWYTIVFPVTYMTYVTKPIVYLSHNKVFREATYQTLPENVRTRTQKVRKVLKNTVNKMDDFIFLRRSTNAMDVDETEVKIIEQSEMKTFRTKRRDARDSNVDASL